MRLIPCRKIREGMELARDVFTGPPGTAPLLRTGVILSDRYAKALPKAGIGSVWIEDDLGRDIDVVEPLTPETRAKVHKATGDALDAAELEPDRPRAGAGPVLGHVLPVPAARRRLVRVPGGVEERGGGRSAPR